jgi:hypothetical protein
LPGSYSEVPSLIPDPTTAVADVQLSDEVLAFCRRNDLLDHLGKAIELARQCFSIVGDPTVQLEQDPEDGEWYLVLEVRVAGEEGECIQAQKGYTRTWANSTPWPQVHLISLICNLSAE